MKYIFTNHIPCNDMKRDALTLLVKGQVFTISHQQDSNTFVYDSKGCMYSINNKYMAGSYRLFNQEDYE